MRAALYVEEDYLRSLLEGQFPQWKTSFVSTSTGLERALRDDPDLLVIQSENSDTLEALLSSVQASGRRLATLVLTSRSARLSDDHRSFAHCITPRQLLETDFRWHVRLAMTMRRLEVLRARFDDAQSVLILLQDDPDPDAIASGLALRHVLGRNKTSAPIGSFGKVTRPENNAMVSILEIEVERVTRARLSHFDRIALVDAQPTHLKFQPVPVDLVIDHHPELNGYTAAVRDIRPGYGATSTILLEYLRCAGITPSERLATALLYGIKSDTFLLAREVNEWDVEAFSYLYPLANQNLMRRIERPELPPAALDALSYALRNRRIIDRVAFVHLGRVEREDLIPQMADFCLQFEGADWSVVSGVYDANFIMSVRNVGYVRAAGKVLRDAFGELGSAGGHASMAKAVIPMSELSRTWNIDVRNVRLMNRRIQKEFLKSLHSNR